MGVILEIYFKDKNPDEVIEGIKEKLGGRKLGDLLDFELEGSDIRVTIRKMGTSVLEFTHSQAEDGHHWLLSKEKLALTHRAFKGEIIEKLGKIVQSLGGQIV